MIRRKELFKSIFSRRTQDSQRLHTASLNIIATVLDSLPVPGAGAFVRSILDVVEGINVSARYLILNAQY
jgi:hypothetical protein